MPLSAPAGTFTSPAKLAEAYLQAILQDDWAAAAQLWLHEDLAASRRLGIRYLDQPFKLDSASSLVLNRERYRAGEVHASVGEVKVDGATARIRILLQEGSRADSTSYFAVATDRGWRLASPITALTADWPRSNTEFLEIRVMPPWNISDAVVLALDRFVTETCARLEIGQERLELLRTRKIGYVWCPEETVAELVGAPTRGVALLQTDTVVTAEPCHLHEVAHLLVNFGLQELPLYTLPFLQEGTAVALGGRWGRGPEVMHGMGRFALDAGLLQPEELLTFESFWSHMPDLTYAPSGVLVGCLLDLLGGGRFLELYRDLSGDLVHVRSLELETVRSRLATAAGLRWEEVRSRLDEYMDRLSCGGLLSGDLEGGEPVDRLEGGNLTVTLTSDGAWLNWTIQALAGPAVGAVLFRGPDSLPEAIPEPGSRLFAEQFPDREFNGELMALVFSPEEIGLYNFWTDLLTAKFVASFCPELAVVVNEGRELRFRIDPKILPEPGWIAELFERP
jgi:hypothetical protein